MKKTLKNTQKTYRKERHGWDYKKVLEVHEALEMVNESINSLGLAPQGF